MNRFAGAALLAGTLASSAVAQTETRSIRGSEVAIYNLVGRMKAVAGTGSEVKVEISRLGRDGSRLKIESGPLRGRETLRIVYPLETIIYQDIGRSRTTMDVNEDGTFGGSSDDWRRRDRDRVTIRSSGTGVEAYADITVSIPKGQRIDLHLGVGRMEISNVDGEILLDVSAADIDVNGAKGVLNLDTGSGRVIARNLTGDVSVDAGSGGITLDKVSGGRVNLDTGSGSIEVSDLDVKEFKADVGSGGIRVMRLKSPVIEVETGSGSANIDVLGPLDRMSVESGSGGVTIRLPEGIGAEIEAETGSGGFQTDFPITSRRFGRNHVNGTIGDGKARIRLESGSGTIRLLKS